MVVTLATQSSKFTCRLGLNRSAARNSGSFKMAVRQLHDHKVNPVNDTLKITVIDPPGAGNASHLYQIDVPTGPNVTVNFQNGPIGEHGVNGITQEALLAIVMDRLRSFQSGPF